MSVRYAVASSVWSSGSTWDNEAVPTSVDNVYANGFNITLDQNINVSQLTNILSPARVPALATPAMTSNTTPSGVAFASAGANATIAFQSFDQNQGTFWQSNTTVTGIIGYQFPTGKIIKQYGFFTWSSAAFNPTAWTFQGSNDGISYTTIETVTGFVSTINTWYIRNVTANTTSYTYYRMNITACGSTPVIAELQMTESTGSVYGTIGSGSFISTDGIQVAVSTGSTAATYGIYAGTGGVAGTHTGCLVITGSHFVGITGSIVGGSGTGVAGQNKHGLLITNGGTGSIIGKSYGGQVQNLVTSANNYGIFVISGSVTVTGSLIGGTSNECVALSILNGTSSISGTLQLNGFASPLIVGAGNAQVNFTGIPVPIAAGGIYANVTAIKVSGNNTGVINYNGPVIAAQVPGIRLTAGTMTVNITGSVSSQGLGNAVDSAIISSVASTINISGSITAAPNAPAIQSTSTSGLVRVTGPLINQNNYPAIFSPKIQLVSTSTPTYTLQTDTLFKNIILYDTSFTSSLPAQNNVRSGSLYGGSNEFSGSMSVPSASNVRYGVPIDNVTGSATLTPQDILTYAVSSLTGSNTIGARLQNIATVQTTAATIAAFKGK